MAWLPRSRAASSPAKPRMEPVLDSSASARITADSLFRWSEFVAVAVPEHRARGVLRTEVCTLRAGDWLPFE